ncbi:hypothetical protein F5Y07DRAFT_392758 [Xylaria sp. FL0933]|nr:hypothetical protein F5Y07DRAFT_392758 [Xylaria sp. FL0933]
MSSYKHHESGSSKGKPMPSTADSQEGKKDTSQKSQRFEENSDLVLFCAIYSPATGNYYHWAFAIFDQIKEWHLFQVVQTVENGPFHADQRHVDPHKSIRCIEVVNLGKMRASLLPYFRNNVIKISVPGESYHWNCQDYVFDIWEMMKDKGMIDIPTWSEGMDALKPYYGPDYGGGDEEDYEDDNEDIEDDGNELNIVSEEFVNDSDSSGGQDS